MHISQFALTYNAYEDEELFDKYHKIYDEYFDEKKHKNSLQHLRALLFFLQRQEHFSGPSKNYVPDSKKIISDIIKFVNKQIKNGKYKKSYLYGNGKAGEIIAELIANRNFKFEKNDYRFE